MNSPAPAWYPDPSNPSQLRYWDGTQWTEHTQPVPQAAPQPSVFVPPAPQPAYSQHTNSSGYGPGPKPDSYLVWSILATLFCCLPFGIVAIINAAKVDSAWAQGNHVEAVERSAAAKKWAIRSLLACVAVGVLYVIAMVFLAGSSVETTLS
jgi:hypothetical protein